MDEMCQCGGSITNSSHDHFRLNALEEQGRGEIFTFSSIDSLAQYLQPLNTFMQCVASQGGKLFILLHEKTWAKPYDGDNHLSHGLGKICFSYMYVHLIHMINHVAGDNFPCIFLKN